MAERQRENLKDIFHAAAALPRSERAAYLEKACDGDQSLRAAVDSLLRSHEETHLVDPPASAAAAKMSPAGVELKDGQRVAHYRILSLLGEGGMGRVYLAEDTKLHRRVAMKFLPSHSAGDDQATKRLLREAQAAAKLDHPNICVVHEVGEENNHSFIVMPYVEGEALDLKMKRKPLELSEALSIAAQVADALSDAHAQGIIHRDIKPGNIIVTPRGHAKVMDFGLAKWSESTMAAGGSKSDPEASTQALLTTPGTIIGTLPYMSPEQVHGQRLDARTDIFSFGVVLYELLTGSQPFAAETPAGTISRILTKEPARLDQYLVDCPNELQRIVDECLEKDREQRCQTLQQVTARITNVQHECADVYRRSSTDGPQKHSRRADPDASAKQPVVRRSLITPQRAIVGAAIVLALTALSGFLVVSRKSWRESNANSNSANASAYDLYLRGKIKNKDHNRESVEAAIQLLEQAVQADPNFAPAYAELARAYGTKVDYFATEAERKKLSDDAKWAVEKSLALNPNLAEGHLVRGYLLWTQANGFPHEMAIQSFTRAIALDSNLPQAHHSLGVVYLHIGLFDKAEAAINRALSLDPTDNLTRFRLGTINVNRGNYEAALQVLDSVPPNANPPLIYRSRAHALFGLGRTDEAWQVVNDYLKMYAADEGGNITSIKAMLLAKAGKEVEALEAIQRAIEIGKGFMHFHHTTFNIACAYALLNKPTEALKWLQLTASDGFPCYPLFKQDPNLNGLRKDERFVAFMAKLKQQWERYDKSL